MVKNVDELKEFIIWAKSQKIKRIKIKGVEVEISDLAFIEDFKPTPSNTPVTSNNGKDPYNGEDPDLFYSSNG